MNIQVPPDALELEARVCRKLEKRPGQSIAERCAELLKAGSGATAGQERMARLILDGESIEPWEAMRRADAVFAEKVDRR